MCGISGILRRTPKAPPPDPRELARIHAALAPRGPDGEGHWSSPDGRLAARPPAARDSGPLAGRRAADDELRRALHDRLQRRDLQLPRARRGAGARGRSPAHPLRHGGHPRALAAGGSTGAGEAARHVRLGRLGRARGRARPGARPVRHQAALLLSRRRAAALRLAGARPRGRRRSVARGRSGGRRGSPVVGSGARAALAAARHPRSAGRPLGAPLRRRELRPRNGAAPRPRAGAARRRRRARGERPRAPGLGRAGGDLPLRRSRLGAGRGVGDAVDAGESAQAVPWQSPGIRYPAHRPDPHLGRGARHRRRRGAAGARHRAGAGSPPPGARDRRRPRSARSCRRSSRRWTCRRSTASTPGSWRAWPGTRG